MTVMATDSNNVTTAKEDDCNCDDNNQQIFRAENIPNDIIDNQKPNNSSVDDASSPEEHLQSVDEFKSLMYSMQSARRKIVDAILGDKEIESDWIEELKQTYAKITDSNTKAFQREMSTLSSKLSINIKDEATGLMKDLLFLDRLRATKSVNENVRWPSLLAKVDLASILAAYHPISEKKFFEEYEECLKFLRSFVESNTNGRKPIFITDWDGTMKDYCSQYATNLQPIYSAVGMTRFASRFTRLSAVLTAGPLRGPGILDLTAMPIDGPVLFSGSWGREWWLGGKRVVHEDGISDEGFDALQRLNDEMGNLLHSGDYSQFALVGSGVQRKVDRLTLGVQTVYGHVLPELSHRYQDAVRERMHRVDPQNHILVFDPSTELEVEVVAHNSGIVWNKADGVDRVVSTVGDSLETPGRVLVCGDTRSDLPMVRQAAARNPEGVMALFVGVNEKLRQSVRQLITDESRRCFVSCPDVIHAAMAELLNQKLDTTQ